jgi:hypothetical protein
VPSQFKILDIVSVGDVPVSGSLTLRAENDRSWTVLVETDSSESVVIVR